MNKAIMLLAAVIGLAASVCGGLSRGYANSGGGGLVGSQGSWGEWGYWSSCSKKCGGGYKTKSRECQKPAYILYGNADCPGSATERRTCNTGSCRVHGGWTEWGYYDDCSAQCGGGTKTRHRYCTNPAPAYGGNQCYGHDYDTVDCNSGYCAVHGGWGAWGSYGDCSAYCGGGYKSKHRYCNNPTPAYGGNPCYGHDYDNVTCNSHHCGISGGWSEWGYYGECSVQCGSGTRNRNRYCNNPAPAYGGAQCAGLDVDTTYCTGENCQVHGGWAEWGYYGDCSAQCGAGTKIRYRTCTNPAPAYGGNDCYGYTSESVDCNSGYCAVQGGWTEWGYYDDCSAQCGGGTKTRHRYCTNPAPAYGGSQCYGHDYDTVDCNSGYCAVHGSWSEWGIYDDCSAQCGGGTKSRHRYCTNPAPAYGGNQCYGHDYDTVDCNSGYCAVHGSWSEWGIYDDCSAQCGGGTKTRHRYCTNPAPAYGGNQCYGHDYDTVDCNSGYCAVQGGWTEWGIYDDCSAQCGSGTKTRHRYCTNPAPAYGGGQCYGHDYDTVDCNSGYCAVHGSWSEWGYYDDCSAQCGGGTKTRHRYCTNPAPAYGGNQCYGHDYDTVDCNSGYCAVNGGWSEWGYYGDCSVPCGSGIKTRYRTCTNPAPGYGGTECFGLTSENHSCNGGSCAVAGGWSYWTNWSSCSGDCGTGRTYRSRSCNNPSPSYNGGDCVGVATQYNSCQLPNNCYYGQGGSSGGY